MTAMLSRRALVTTLIGAVLLIGGALTVTDGLAQRYASAHSAITMHEQPRPNDRDDYTYYSFAGDGVHLDDQLSMMTADMINLLLHDAEARGSFDVPALDVYVQEKNVVAVSAEAPDTRVFSFSTTIYRPWTPHAYMIPVFAGGLITFAGLFWLAARWHVAASVRRREIDETPL